MYFDINKTKDTVESKEWYYVDFYNQIEYDRLALSRYTFVLNRLNVV